MKPEDKIYAFILLGKFFAQFRNVSYTADPDLKELNSRYAEKFNQLISKEKDHNAWFTPENVRFALGSLADALKEEQFRQWLSAYDLKGKDPERILNIGVIMAGNIPLVGFHDFISVIFSGHRLTAKLSAKDDRLFPVILEMLIFLNPAFGTIVHFEDGPLKDPGAVIATGSNNTARYFNYYFGKYPHIIRKNRNAVAVLDGSETSFELENLGVDIFTYFGLGCRNVSKIYVPDNYEIPHLLNHLGHYAYLANHHKYANNYEYYRAVHLLNQENFYDTGFLVVREDSSYSSPVGSLHFETYRSQDTLRKRLAQDRDQLQCIVARHDITQDRLGFGQTQTPMLRDYADNVDTMKFLLNL